MAVSSRRLQRYLVPGFLVSVRHYFRARALVSWSARVQWGPEVSLGKGTVVKAFAVIQSSGGAVRFGRDCAISSFVHVSTGAGDIVVGDGVRIAPNCTLVGGTKEVRAKSVPIRHQPEAAPRGLWIGDDVLIGANAVILPGSHIGTGAVVGAGRVVSGEILEYAIVAGAPAKIIGHRE